MARKMISRPPALKPSKALPAASKEVNSTGTPSRLPSSFARSTVTPFGLPSSPVLTSTMLPRFRVTLRRPLGASSLTTSAWAVGRRILPLVFRHRLLWHGSKGRGRRGGFRIGKAVQDGGLARGARPLQGGGEIDGLLDALAVSAEGARIGGEVRVLQHGGRDAPRIFALLVSADRPVHAVVEDDDEDGQL